MPIDLSILSLHLAGGSSKYPLLGSLRSAAQMIAYGRLSAHSSTIASYLNPLVTPYSIGLLGAIGL